MTIQTATRNLPTYKPMTAATTQHEPADPTDSWRSGENADRLLVLGGAAATLGTVAFACFQGHPVAALGGGALAAATGMAMGIPLAYAGRPTTADSIGLYVASSLSSLTVGAAAGALLGGNGLGLLAATGAGAAAALAGNLVGRHV